MPKYPGLNILRHSTHKRPAEQRVHDFGEIDSGFTPLESMAEASRCVQCTDAPCAQLGCPLHNDIPRWLDHVVNGRFREAARIISLTSNMPEACGKLCPTETLCESRCVVGQYSRPVAIGRLEEFVTRLARQKGWFIPQVRSGSSGFRVAVVGSGPTGLSACEQLLDQDHAVTVFEKQPVPGGLPVYGIPSFKYDKDRMVGLIERLRAKGAEFRCGVTVGADVTIDDLLGSAGYDAVLLAVGAEAGRKPDIPGAHLANVYMASDFLIRANLSGEYHGDGKVEPIPIGKRCVIVGGGDTAMDCVRSAVRLGFEEVHGLYRRGESEMTGRYEDRGHAVEEGTKFTFLSGVIEILGTESVEAVKCIRMELTEPDDSGRRSPVPVSGSEFTLPADAVVFALGYTVEYSLAAAAGCQATQRGVKVDEHGMTTRPGVFAAGDAVLGADLIVTAVREGRKAAMGICKYLSVCRIPASRRCSP